MYEGFSRFITTDQRCACCKDQTSQACCKNPSCKLHYDLSLCCLVQHILGGEYATVGVVANPCKVNKLSRCCHEDYKGREYIAPTHS
jgi:hypothetical protein